MRINSNKARVETTAFEKRKNVPYYHFFFFFVQSILLTKNAIVSVKKKIAIKAIAIKNRYKKIAIKYDCDKSNNNNNNKQKYNRNTHAIITAKVRFIEWWMSDHQ